MDDEIYDHIIFLADPELSEPVLVIALEGWIDAGLGASNAIGTMLDTIYTEVLATFDTEYFIDQRARRPIARIVDGITTELTWPEIQLRFGRDGDGADILFLVGPEPPPGALTCDSWSDSALSRRPHHTPAPYASSAPPRQRVRTC
jgi:hypothetical protein